MPNVLAQVDADRPLFCRSSLSRKQAAVALVAARISLLRAAQRTAFDAVVLHASAALHMLPWSRTRWHRHCRSWECYV